MGAAALAGSSGGTANRLLLVVSGCYTSAKHDFPFVFHPTGLVISGSAAFGMVVGNFLLNAGFAAFCFSVFCAGRRFSAVTSSSYLHNLDIQGFLRLPSFPLLLFALLYQGSALGSMALIYDPPSTIAFAAGLCSAVFCVMVPLLVFCEVRKGVPSLAFFKEDDRYTGFGWRMLIGKGEWVSTTPKVLYAHRFQSVLTVYNEDKAWFGLVRFGSSFALAALSAPVTEDFMSCGHVKLCSALVVLMELAAMIRVWPYAMSRDALAGMVISFSEGGGMLLMAAGYYASDPYNWTHSMATVFFQAAMYTVIAQMLLDLATEAFVSCTRRRARLQDLVFAGFWSGDGSKLGDSTFLPFSEPRCFGKGGSLPAGVELSPGLSLFSTEAGGGRPGASARRLSVSLVSSSPSEFVFPPQMMDDPLLSPTLSQTSLLTDGLYSSSLRSAVQSSPEVPAPAMPVGRRNRRLASVAIQPVRVPSPPESHHHQGPSSQPWDDAGQRSSLLSPRASATPEQRNLSNTVTLPLSAAARRVRRSPLPQVTSPTASSAPHAFRLRSTSSVWSAPSLAASSRMERARTAI
ncbi:hypothetical protein DIPPA_20411 [Diplonema papillatum]|nr:hypothetical protein DIPPA_20411 [Diplonema papillatum]